MKQLVLICVALSASVEQSDPGIGVNGPTLGVPGAGASPTDLQRALQEKDFPALDRMITELASRNEGCAAAAIVLPAVHSSEPAVRRLAAYALSQLVPEAAKQEIPALIEALRDEEPRVRARVALALGNLGPPARSAVPALSELLRDPNPRARAGAARALGLIGPEARIAVPRLTELLKDPEPPVRGLAAFALGEMGPAARFAVPALAAVRSGDADANVRASAATAIEALDPPVPVLMDALADRDSNRRLWAVSILTEKGPAARLAVPKLIAILRADDTPVVRAGAALVLGKIGPEARSAVPDLIAALQDPIARVRTGAALALGLIGPEARAAGPALVEALHDEDAEVSSSAATALGNLGPAAEGAVPGLIDLLHQPSTVLRRRAVNVLARVGPCARAATQALLEALNDRTDAIVRREAVRALISTGPQAQASVAALIEALQAHDSEIDPNVRAWACLSLALIGPQAGEEAVAPLIAALHDEDGNVRKGAALALSKIGSAAVPALVTALDHLDARVRAGAAQALGGIGPGGRRVLAILRRALRDEDGTVRLAVAAALARIAGDLQMTQATQSLADLQDTLKGLEGARPDGLRAEQQAEWNAAELQLRAAIDALQTVRRARFVERIEHSAWFPWAAGSVLYVTVLLAIWLALLRFRPLVLLRINDALRPFPHVRLPGPLSGVEMSPATLLLVRWFHYHPRVLDAWVGQFLAEFRETFQGRRTVQDRRVYVPVPIVLDGQVVPAAMPEVLGKVFARKRGCLLIWGEGGSGKTSLACQLGRWALAEDRSERLCEHIMLPVLIEHDLDLKIAGGKPAFTALTEAVRGQLQALIDEAGALPEEMLEHLLRQRRILVIVDHLSEISPAARDAIRPGSADFPAHALVVTSRSEETLDDVPRSVVQPLRIEGNRLSSFMEAYLVQRGKRQLFTDAEYFEACHRLSLLVGNREVTVLLAKLYAEQMIARKETGGHGAPPGTLPDLMLGYLHELNRAVGKEHRSSDFEVQRDAGIVAWECLKPGFRPGPARLEAVLDALGGTDARPRLEYLEERLRLIRIADPAPDLVGFTLDPLAEYLAAIHLVNRNRGNAGFWREFLAQADALQAEQGTIDGFLLAVLDSCKLRDPGAAVVQTLGERLQRAA